MLAQSFNLRKAQDNLSGNTVAQASVPGSGVRRRLAVSSRMRR
jgi:hypothetical protein